MDNASGTGADLEDPVAEWSGRFRCLALLGAFLVVVIHCTSWFQARNHYLWAFGYHGFCGVAVPFFFLVSGALFGRHVDEPGWWRRETAKRCRSLLVPYFFWLTLVFVCRLALLPLFGESISFDWRNLAVDFGLMPFAEPRLRPLWYVRELFGLVLVAPAFVWSVRKLRKVGLVLIFLALPLADGAFFLLGMAFGMRAVDLRLPKRTAWIVFAEGVVLMAVGAVCSVLYDSGGHVRGLAMPFLVIGGLNLAPNLPVPPAIAATAFPIYVMHMFFVAPLGFALQYERWQDTWFEPLVVLGGALTVYGATMKSAMFLRRRLPQLNGLLWGGR